jgi:nicotinamidase-related amidase
VAYDPATVRRWQERLAPHLRAAPPAVAARSALVVVDVQHHFAPLCEEILPTLRRAVEGCHRLSVPVYFTQHGHADPAVDGGMLGEWWSQLIVEGTPDHGLLPGVGMGAGDEVVAKRRYDAFHETGLEKTLRARGVEDLAVAGVMTNLCVETTARTAFVRDFRVRVLLDATATDSEQMHLAALANLAHGFAHVQTTDEWLSSLEA